MRQRPIIVFDVNETQLDLATIRPSLVRIFDDPAATRRWFAGLITYSEALTLAGSCALHRHRRGRAADAGCNPRDHVTEADAAERFASMPPHPEVPAAPRRLREAASGCSP